MKSFAARGASAPLAAISHMWRRLGAASGLFLGWLTLRAAPEFAGVLTAPGLELYALDDPERGDVPRWLRKGEQFEGCTILAYGSGAETLVLAKDGREIVLSLRQARVLPRVADPGEMMRMAAQEIARHEHWPDRVRFQGPHLFKDEWLVVAHHEANGRFETRIVVFTPTGTLKAYLRAP